ncbi:22590_t:CDS:1, partial [Cetraspora pellucida]
EYRNEVGEVLKANPTVDETVNLALNCPETLLDFSEYRVRPTRIDLENETGTIDIDYHPQWNECQCGPHTKINNWWLVKDLQRKRGPLPKSK